MPKIVAIDAAHNLAFDRDEVLEDPLEALNICSSLVTITTNKAKVSRLSAQRIIALVHYSVQEYLLSDRIKQGGGKAVQHARGQMPQCVNKRLLDLLNPISAAIVSGVS